ncbi:protein of unknown function UPF0029 [Petrotoga mobilis SJ95]|uniref:Impact N-terminal domain-containing protein n=1 Tax=Petrotoga mobilis (strain DSM 10674 / SJ95) TaxID=403833 RepID=A9BI01_PETMO|nr:MULTISPECIES: YigZ family protein [Petrotoga]MDK2812260.1 hypothetical protein [Petrotoga sp.]ABX32116.1 protein of unknown function UPF0029 [Petrotoga mobilis SJ95]PNR90070.1 hypothetical protein X925_00715 [Petrotoga sp. 9T1HF07.CasAA.8.2]PNR92356.1 hypothetical protein X926_06250 [Petrotoga sp. HWHPT.55.6.3]RPD35283.1 hypothetical protein HWHPT5561_08020 [Petrotoga sp. HWH.PT.55.6.1]
MNYKSIKDPIEITYTVERSKFIGNIAKTNSVDEAQKFIKQISQMYNNATHNCWAYKVHEGGREIANYSDNNEPSGTAGKPIYGVIEKFGLLNVTIVVTRYFGGVKLGIRGLIDAYSKTAEDVVKASKVVTYEKVFIYEAKCDYSNFSFIQNLMQKQNNFKIIKQNFSDEVYFIFEVLEDNKEDVLSLIKNKVYKLNLVGNSEGTL